MEKCFLHLFGASNFTLKHAKRFFEKFWFFVVLFAMRLKVVLPLVKLAWQLCYWCQTHKISIYLQTHHIKDPLKVSLKYLYWFQRYSTFRVSKGFIFSQNQPSLGHFDTKKSGFWFEKRHLKNKTLNILRTKKDILMKLLVNLSYGMDVNWCQFNGCGIISMVATSTIPRAVLLSNML